HLVQRRSRTTGQENLGPFAGKCTGHSRPDKAGAPVDDRVLVLEEHVPPPNDRIPQGEATVEWPIGARASPRAEALHSSSDMEELPTGTVTFLFTDIEGSTRLMQELGERYTALRDNHASIVRRAVSGGGGVEVSTAGDSFFAAFPTPMGAVGAAVAAQQDLAASVGDTGAPVRVRMGIHTGEAVLTGRD